MRDLQNLKLKTDISIAHHQKTPKMEFRSKSQKNPLQDYTLHEQIGQGGFANVYRATHKPTGEEVAVKIMTISHFNSEQMEFIELEIRLQQCIAHPNIAQLFEVVKTPNKIYMVMEYCPGGQLFDKISKNGTLPEKEAAKVFQQILAALLYLKTMHISHRDIKPENILFDQKNNVKLIDFGLGCRQTGDQDIFRRTFCGTPSYSPPQIILKQQYDPELMDVWGLGVTLYAMLAGEFPFSGKTREEQRNALINYRWTPKFHFSRKVNKLFYSIFTEASKRVNLQDLLCSSFITSYKLGNFEQSIPRKDIIQTEILEMTEVECQVEDSKFIVSSIKNNRLDRYHAIYFLLLKREERNAKSLQNSFLFKVKKLRHHMLKLDKTNDSPIHKRKQAVNVPQLRPLKKQSGLEHAAQGRGRTLDFTNLKVTRRAATPESPRVALSSLVNSRVIRPPFLS